MPELEKTKCNKACVALNEETNKIHSDQTGRFPVKYSRGYQHAMIICIHHANSILNRPLKGKQAVEIQVTHDKVYSCITIRGHEQMFYRLDNEILREIQDLLDQAMGATVELAPPHLHIHRTVERAMRAAKNHLITMLSRSHGNFPLSMWCHLLKQDEITLNLFRASRIHPQSSAHQSLRGNFNFTRTPLDLPSIKVIAHNYV